MTPTLAQAIVVSQDPDHYGLNVAIIGEMGGQMPTLPVRVASHGPRARAVPSASQTDPNTRAALEELQRKFGTKVLLHASAPGKPGQLIFEYYDSSDLARIYDSLMQH